MKKICFYTGSLKQGGAERDISVLANQLVIEGYDVSIVLVFSNEIFFKLNSKIKLIDFSKDILDRSAKNIFLLKRKIRELHNKEHFDVTICNMIGLNFLLVHSLKKYKNTSLICRVVSDPKSWSLGKKIFANHFYKKADKVILQTEYQKLCFRKKVRQKSIIIPNICETDININSNDNFLSKDLIYTGRLNVPVKRIDKLIEGFSIFHSKYPEYKLHLYGEYPNDNGKSKLIIQETIKKFNLFDSVIVDGPTIEIANKINNAFCMVFSSPFEGMPNALLEAQVSGLPIVSSNFRGASCFIENNVNGLIYSFGESDKLANLIEKLVNNKDLYDAISKNGNMLKEKYMMQSIIKIWVGLFE